MTPPLPDDNAPRLLPLVKERRMAIGHVVVHRHRLRLEVVTVERGREITPETAHGSLSQSGKEISRRERNAIGAQGLLPLICLVVMVVTSGGQGRRHPLAVGVIEAMIVLEDIGMRTETGNDTDLPLIANVMTETIGAAGVVERGGILGSETEITIVVVKML